MVDKAEAIAEIEEAYYLSGMTLAAMLTAAAQAREQLSILFRRMTGYETAIVHIQPPIDRLGQVYSVSALKEYNVEHRGGEILAKDIYRQDIDLFTFTPDEMSVRIYDALLKIAAKMKSDETAHLH